MQGKSWGLLYGGIRGEFAWKIQPGGGVPSSKSTPDPCGRRDNAKHDNDGFINMGVFATETDESP